tara:strand:- start:31847 stop:32245 length:399 start_codon:yes stop_codon:yes gene_type:complete
MKSLLSLPNELFQHVASLLPFSAFLRLGCVNRRPNHICNDRLVLHDIAKNVHHNINGATHFIFDKYAQPSYVNLRLEQLEWVDSEPLLGGTSVRIPSEAAHVVERCINSAFTKLDDWTLRTSKYDNGYDLAD